MTIRGKVKNGKVVLENPRAIADGTEVEVRPAKNRKPATKRKKPAKSKSPPRSLAERLAPFIGILKDLPPDAAVNVDHYVYGLPKRS